MSEQQKILIVDDKKANLVALEQTLSETKAQIVKASSGNEALNVSLDHDFALAILDVQMPDMDGYELAEFLRADDKTRSLPIIFLTAALVQEADIFKGYESGGIDYILKPYSPAILLNKVDVFLELDHQRRELLEKQRLIETKNIELKAFAYSLSRIAVAANEALVVAEAMQICLDEVCTLTGWPVGHVYLLAEDGTDELTTAKLWHLDKPRKFKAFRQITESTRFAPGIGLPGRVMVSGKPAWIIDVTKDPNFPRAKHLDDIGLKAAFAFPVLVGREVTAVLEFFTPEAVEPNEKLLEVMAQVGTQLGRVIERERAVKELRMAHDELELRVEERTAELNEQTRYLQLMERIAVASNEASHIKEAMQVCLDEVCALTGWPVGHVYHRSYEDNDEYISAKVWHLDKPRKFKAFKQISEEIRFTVGSGLPGRVAQSGKPAWITDISKDPNFPRAQQAGDIGLKAAFAFPIKVGNGVSAVLEFFTPEIVEPDQPLLDVMAYVGTQLGVIVERWLAKNELSNREEQFRILNLLSSVMK